MVNIDSSEIDSGDSKEVDEDKDAEKDDQSTSTQGALTTTQADELCAWFVTALTPKVSQCKTTNRLSSSPAVITGNESAAYRRIMRMVETSEGGVEHGALPLPKQTVEINPKHEIITGLYALKDTDPDLAQVLAEQIFDNCLTAAGLLDDGRTMLPRLNDLLLCIVKAGVEKSGPKVVTSQKKESDSATLTEEEKFVKDLQDAGFVAKPQDEKKSDEPADAEFKPKN